MAFYNMNLARSPVEINGNSFDGELKLKSVTRDVRLPDLPYEFYASDAVVYKGELHILGGEKNLTGHYKLNGDNWESVSTLPTSFSHGRAVVYKDEIYISCYYNSSRAFYKFNGSTWTSVTNTYVSYSRTPMVVYLGFIYLLGARSSSSYDRLYRYNGSTWTNCTSMPIGGDYAAADVYDGYIHITGGSDNTKAHYRCNGSSFTSLGTLLYPAQSHILVALEDGLHSIGGTPHANSTYLSYADSARHTRYDGTSWEELSKPAPYKVVNSAAVAYENTLCIIGCGLDTSYNTSSSASAIEKPNAKSCYKLNTEVYEVEQ